MSLLDIAHPSFKADLYPQLASLRESAPVHRVRMGRQQAWLVMRYDDVERLLRDDRMLKDRSALRSGGPGEDGGLGDRLAGWLAGPLKPLLRNMLDTDEPDHRRLRGLVQKAFTPRRVQEMEDRIRELAEHFMGEMNGAAAGPVDLIAGYALPLPATVIAELLGVPVEDRHRFHRWTRAIVSVESAGIRMVRALPSVVAFVAYLRELIAERRRDPRDDLVGALVRAEEAGDRLTEDELVAMLFLLLVAGHETTVNLIGNGTLALLDHPAALEALRADPALVADAVEEMLRYDGPLLTATERWASERMELGGATIEKGDLLLAGLASANRDPRKFEAPDRFDIRRRPNPHLSFGKGVHFCLGAPLARLEGRIAFETLLNCPRLELAVPRAELRRRRGPVLSGLESLPVLLGS